MMDGVLCEFSIRDEGSAFAKITVGRFVCLVCEFLITRRWKVRRIRSWKVLHLQEELLCERVVSALWHGRDMILYILGKRKEKLDF